MTPSNVVLSKLSRSHRASIWMLTACGVWLLSLGSYFVLLRPALLPEDPRFIGTTIAQLRSAVPGLEAWLRIVFTVMGGYMVASGVLAVFLAQVAMPRRLKGTAWALALAGLSTVALMSAMNFELRSDFRWVLVLPAAIWVVGIATYAMSDSASATAR